MLGDSGRRPAHSGRGGVAIEDGGLVAERFTGSQDIHGVAELTDQNVVNPWGIAHSASETIYVVNNGTGVATEYFEDGTPAPSFANPHIIMIPRSAGNTEGANPTGVVWNSTSSFGVSNGTNTLPAKLIFVSEDGMISGWNPNLNNTHAFRAVDRGAAGAIFKGVASGVANNHNFIYATKLLFAKQPDSLLPTRTFQQVTPHSGFETLTATLLLLMPNKMLPERMTSHARAAVSSMCSIHTASCFGVWCRMEI